MIKTMALSSVFALSCVIAVPLASAQPGPGRGGYPYPGGGPGGPGGPSTSRYVQSGDPSGGSRHGHPSVPSTRFSTVPPSERTYGGPTGAPPVSPRHAPSGYYGGRSPMPSRAPEIRSAPERFEETPRVSPDLPVQERLKLPLLNHMRRQGNDLINEGQDKKNENKIRMGNQYINKANERIERLRQQDAERGPSGESDRSRNSRGRGRY